MNEKELLQKFLQKTLSLTGNEFASLYEDDKLKDDAMDILEDKHSQKIQSIKEENKDLLTKKFDDGHKKGKKEALSDWEKQVKEEFEFDSNASGVDFVRELVASQSDTDVSEEKVKTHPLYLGLEKDRIPKSKYEELQKEFEGYKLTKETGERKGVLRKDGYEVLMSLNPVLNENTEKAARQVDLFLNTLIDGHTFQLQDNKKHLLMDGDKRVEDKHGNPTFFDEFVAVKAGEIFDFKKQDSRSNGGNETGEAIVIPKSKEEYLERITKEKDPEKRVELMKSWESNS